MSESSNSAGGVEQLYENLCDRIQALRESGHEPDRVVVPGEDWSSIKEMAEVRPGEGVAGSDQVLVNGVSAVYDGNLRTGRVIFRVERDQDE